MSSPSGASFSLRCLIYKVHAVVCSKQVYCTLAQLFAFVKKIFFFFRQRFFCFSVTALIIYHRLPGLSSTFFIFLQMHGASHQLFFSNVAPHCRQVTLILPFPRGTRNLMPQEGQRKILYCLLCSILTRQLWPACPPRNKLKNFWFSCCRRPRFLESARTMQNAAANKQSPWNSREKP